MFTDRSDAGKKLALELKKYRNNENVVVIGLARGGVVTAFEVAAFLRVPLEVLCPRKVGAPNNPELALGAVTETGAGFFNEELIRHIGVRQDWFEAECKKEQERSKCRLELFRKNRPPLDVQDKIVIVVDDGLATGATMKAAILSLQGQKAKKTIVAIPVSPLDTAKEIQKLCDEFICLDLPWFFQSVGQFYEQFPQTEDEEVVALLQMNQKES